MALKNCALMVVAGLAISAFSIGAAGQPQPSKPMPPKPSATPATAPAPIDPSKPHSQITFDKTSHDFGVINDDAPVNTEFKFTNAGSGTLEIANVQGSCGCTVPALDKKSYAPGEGGVIKVSYNPHGRRGKQQTTVTVTSNDPAKPSQVLELHSEIKPLLLMDPQVANIGQVPKDKPTTSTILITSRQKDLKPTQASSSTPSIVAKLLDSKETQLEGETVTQTPLEISTAPGADVGQVASQVTIRTTDPARLLYLSVMGEIVGDVVMTPQRVQLSAKSPGEKLDSEVRLTGRNGKTFNVLKVEEAPKATGAGTPMKMFDITFTQDKAANPPAWVIKVAGTAPEAQGAFSGDLLVTTDIPDEKTVKVPYFGFTRPPAPVVSAWDSNPSLLAR